MNAIMPTTVRRQYPPDRPVLQPVTQGRQRPWRLPLLSLTAICAMQACLSLSLVWSNTAFADEAYYLWTGHLEIAHLLHGTSVPQTMLDGNLSGSPFIYPPIGALADSVGGLAGARILSLIFVLGTTVLLYFTASRLFSPRAAIIASVLWATSEPTIRLAFATYDPLSVFMTALSVWLIVQAGYRRCRAVIVAASAVTLALANATAYSGMVIDPVVIAFALLLWLRLMPRWQAWFYAACFTAGVAVFLSILIIVTHSLAGIMYTVLNRNLVDYQSITLVVSDIWKYSGIVIVLCIAGSVVAIAQDGWHRALPVILLGCAIFVVPAAQIHDRTGTSLDKHLAYGIWFAAMAAGYGLSKLIRPVVGRNKLLSALCCVVAVVYPVTTGWESAWKTYHSWANSAEFIAAFRPVAARSPGSFSLSGGAAGQYVHITEYYTRQGTDWTRWDNPVSLTPNNVPPRLWIAYYREELRRENYGAVALIYQTSFSSEGLPGSVLLTRHTNQTYRNLLNLIAANSNQPGLSVFTVVLEQDPAYRIVSVGPYDSGASYGGYQYGIYAIWQKVQQKAQR